MNTNVVPLNAATKFLMDRTTKNLIDFLKDSAISSSHDSSLVTQLLTDVDKPVLADHENLFEFDKELWSVLSQLNIYVPWWQFADREVALELAAAIEFMDKPLLSLVSDSDTPNMTTSVESAESTEISSLTPDQLKETVAEYTVHNEEQKSSPDTTLSFFNEVNEHINKSDIFKKNIKYAKEISQLLVDLVIEKKSVSKVEKRSLTSSSWDWLFPTVCAGYAAFLITNTLSMSVSTNAEGENLGIEENKKVSSEEAGAAFEAVGFFSILMLSLLALNGVESLHSVTRPIYFYLKKCQFIDDEAPAVQLVLTMCDTTTGSSAKVTVESLDMYVGIFSSVMTITEATRFIRSDAYFTFVQAYLEEKWEVADSKLEQIMYQPIHSILSTYLYADDEEAAELMNRFLLFKKADKSQTVKLIGKYIVTGPDRRFSQYILKNMNHEYWDSDNQYFYELNSLTVDYAQQLNKEFIKSGFPASSNLAENVDDLGYIRVFPSHYDCISTLAIPLSSSEFYQDNFHESSPTDRFVAGARTLADAGYPIHALVFLSYGLMRVCLQIVSRYESNFSVQQVQGFISRPEIAEHLEQYFIPSIRFISNNCPDLPFATKIWIDALLERFHADGIDVNAYIAGQEKLTPVLISIPKWFSNEEESLINSIHDYKNVTEKFIGKDWPRFFIAKDLRSKLRSISESLESVAIDLFRPYFNLCKSDNATKSALIKLSDTSEIRFDSLTLGWIQRFLKRITNAMNDDLKASAVFLEAVQKGSYPLGKAIYRMQQLNTAAADSFDHFRVIDNSLSHRESKVRHPGVLNKSQSDWLISYAISDFAEIYDLFN